MYVCSKFYNRSIPAPFPSKFLSLMCAFLCSWRLLWLRGWPRSVLFSDGGSSEWWWWLDTEYGTFFFKHVLEPEVLPYFILDLAPILLLIMLILLKHVTFYYHLIDWLQIVNRNTVCQVVKVHRWRGEAIFP